MRVGRRKRMRHLTSDELKTIHIEEDMLKGNLNRMCVTEELTELDTMTQHAKNRIENIRRMNYKRLMEGNDEV